MNITLIAAFLGLFLVKNDWTLGIGKDGGGSPIARIAATSAGKSAESTDKIANFAIGNWRK